MQRLEDADGVEMTVSWEDLHHNPEDGMYTYRAVIKRLRECEAELVVLKKQRCCMVLTGLTMACVVCIMSFLFGLWVAGRAYGLQDIRCFGT